MTCPRCKLDHALWADRQRFTKAEATLWFQHGRHMPIYPSQKVRICEALSEEELRALRP